MKLWETLAAATTPDGGRFELRRRDGNYVIQADGYDLMTSYTHGSEDSMMSLACPRPREDACILIGGLGMGYTLAATLDLLPPGGSVVVNELVPEVVDVIRDSESRFDAGLLDVDNGVDSFPLARNSWLYTSEGLVIAHRSLRTRGALAVWQAGAERTFEDRLRAAGFTASTHPDRRRDKRGAHYAVFVGR